MDPPAPIPQLETDRLVLRPLAARDEAFVARLLSDPDVRRHLGGPVPADRHGRVFAAYLAHRPPSAVWTVLWRGRTAAPLGLVFLTPHAGPEDGTGQLELSYMFDPASWGQGLAGEAVGAVLDHARSLGARGRILAETQAANLRSKRMLRRLGFAPIRRFERFGAIQVLYAANLRTAGRKPLWLGARVAIFLQSLVPSGQAGRNREK